MLLALKELLVLQDQPVLLVLLEQLVQLVQQDRKVQQVLQVLQEPRVLLELLVMRFQSHYSLAVCKIGV